MTEQSLRSLAFFPAIVAAAATATAIGCGGLVLIRDGQLAFS